MVRYFLYILLLVSLLYCCGKNDGIDCEDPDYSDCNTTEPEYGEVQITVTKHEKTSRVPLLLYRGKFGEQGSLIFNDTVTSVDTSVLLDFENDYYAIAVYNIDNNTTYAVDGAYLKKKSSKLCDSVCWTVKGNQLDVRLK